MVRRDAARAAETVGETALRRKLAWLTFFRLITMAVLLGGTAIAAWRGAAELVLGAGPLFALITTVCVASLGFALLLRARLLLLPMAYAQIALDMAVAAVVVAMTGLAESVYVFLFSLAIVNGAILLFRRGAVVALGLALAAYGGVLVAAGHPAAGEGLMVFAHASAFLATGALAGYLAEQLRETGERLRAREIDLANVQALQEAIVQSVSSGIVTTDAEGRVTYMNPAAEEISGVLLAEALGERAERWFAGFQGDSGREENILVNARGERLRVGYSVFPLRAAGAGAARHLGTAVIFQDLTRLREMEEAMKRSERLADLGRLAAGLAHELKNPIAAVMGSIELIRQEAALEPAKDRLLAIILRETSRLDALVTRFLEFARPAPPCRDPVDVAELLRETAQVFENHPTARQVRVEQELQGAHALGDSHQLRQVAWNLLVNAAEALRDAGRPGTVRLACGPAGAGKVAMAVSDDGPGIAAGDMPRLFTPFHTTKRDGTGLGLAIVQRIVDAHGGRVEVESAPGQGARFRVTLPAAPLAS